MKKDTSQASRSKKIRQGDRVLVISGNCKGQTGEVLHFKGNRVVVQGVNMCKKHVKPSEHNQKGGVIEIEAALDSSNVCNCDENGAPVKLKTEIGLDGTRQLYYMKEQTKVLYRSMKLPKK